MNTNYKCVFWAEVNDNTIEILSKLESGETLYKVVYSMSDYCPIIYTLLAAEDTP